MVILYNILVKLPYHTIQLHSIILKNLVQHELDDHPHTLGAPSTKCTAKTGIDR
jgi:hypothetical protein